jgi:hypothetical protein
LGSVCRFAAQAASTATLASPDAWSDAASRAGAAWNGASSAASSADASTAIAASTDASAQLAAGEQAPVDPLLPQATTASAAIAAGNVIARGRPARRRSESDRFNTGIAIEISPLCRARSAACAAAQLLAR